MGVNDAALSPLTLLYNGAASVPVNTGIYVVTASFAGDENYNPVANNQQSIMISRAGQAITFGTLTNKTFGDSPFTVDATSSSGLPVSLAVLSGLATINGNMVTINGAGMVTLRASQAGDANYNAATPVDQPFTVTKAGQTISCGALADKTFGDPDFTVSATASSGLSVSFGALGNCTISGRTVHITGAGSGTITAAQAGDSNYNAAASVPQSFTIAKANQTITFGAIANKTFGDPDFIVNPTASSGLPVSLSATGNCTVTSPAPGTVHLTGAGSCAVTAAQAGNANFNAATNVSQSFSIGKADQIITF